MNDVEKYLKNCTPAQQTEYKRLQKIVSAQVPDVEEVMSYGIPTFKYRGKFVLYFGAFKDHMSVFGAIDAIRDEAKDFKLSKGTLQYTENKLVPEELISKMVASRMAAIDKKN